MAKETVTLYFPPTGETREVEANAEALTPLMAKGWHQAPKQTPKPVAPAKEAK